jgi:hypothetical protein
MKLIDKLLAIVPDGETESVTVGLHWTAVSRLLPICGRKWGSYLCWSRIRGRVRFLFFGAAGVIL